MGFWVREGGGFWRFEGLKLHNRWGKERKKERKER